MIIKMEVDVQNLPIDSSPDEQLSKSYAQEIDIWRALAQLTCVLYCFHYKSSPPSTEKHSFMNHDRPQDISSKGIDLIIGRRPRSVFSNTFSLHRAGQ